MAHVTFFAFDISEAAQIRRIESIRSLGHSVQSFSFRRENMNPEFTSTWPNVDLGRTENGKLVRRLGSVFSGIVKSFMSRRELSISDVWIARNLDQLVIAWAVRVLTLRRDVKLIYECLDIHNVMTRRDAIGACARLAERFLLARTDLVILSSEGFMREYFASVQGVRPRVALVENKLWLEHEHLPRPIRPRQATGPLVLGWIGTLRCRQSLDLLAEVARRMGASIQVQCHGVVHRHALPDFDRILQEHANISYLGPYKYPQGLGAVYAACDLVWAQDMWQAGTNSDWLLPNRIYEAGYFGCPSVALAATETGRRIVDDGLGYVIAAPTADNLVGLLECLNRREIGGLSTDILAKPDGAFQLYPKELAKKLAPVLGASVANDEAGSMSGNAPRLEHS